MDEVVATLSRDHILSSNIDYIPTDMDDIVTTLSYDAKE